MEKEEINLLKFQNRFHPFFYLGFKIGSTFVPDRIEILFLFSFDMEKKGIREVKKDMKETNANMKLPALVVASVLLMGLMGSSFVLAGGFGVNPHASANANNSIWLNKNVGLRFRANAQVQAHENNQERERTPSQISEEMRNQNSFGFQDDDNLSSSSLIEERINALQVAHARLVASGFAQVDHGTGWAISNNNTGSLLNILLVERTFVNTSDNTSGEITLRNGVLKMTNSNAFYLKLSSNTLTNSNFNYEVRSKGEVVGNLSLIRENHLSGFSTWEGILKLNSGESYTLTFATINRKARLGANAQNKSSSNGQVNHNGNLGGKIKNYEGLWGRIRSFFGFRQQSSVGSNTSASANENVEIEGNSSE